MCWMLGKKKESFTCKDLEVCFPTSDISLAVRSQFRAWVHGYRLIAIIFTVLVAWTSPQQQVPDFLLPCMSNWKGKTLKKILFLGYLQILGQWLINYFLLFQNIVDFLPACMYFGHFAYTEHSMISLSYIFSSCFSGKQIFMAGVLVSEKLQAKRFLLLLFKCNFLKASLTVGLWCVWTEEH